MNRFLSGEIQITNELPLEHFKRLKKEHPESVQVQGQLCTYYYGFNNKSHHLTMFAYVKPFLTRLTVMWFLMRF